MPQTRFTIQSITLSAVRIYLLDHACHLDTLGLHEQAKLVRNCEADLQEQVRLQIPQTLEEQTAALTNIMGCGPEPEHNK